MRPRAAWSTRTKTELCACARASLRLRPGIFVCRYLCGLWGAKKKLVRRR